MNIKIKGLNVEYLCEGEGEAVVLLHGWGSNKELYKGIISVVSQKYMALAPDLPGFGASEEPKEPWSVGDYADFVIELLERLNIKKAVFIGHSYGGRVIFKLSSQFQREAFLSQIT